MTKLKTLKDFKRKQYSEGEDKKGNKIKFFDERELKQEAIKHYKAVKNGDLVIDVLTYIRWANNLTEAELKNEN